ncbi:MAG: PilX N-terminal domain-containing pilus assembly protein [Steroidobacteraceae bacterium]
MKALPGEVAASARGQRGVALVVALILLVVATLIGLAATRTTMLQEKMSGNTFDRSLAFQRTESALRAAEVAITADWQIATLNGLDCSPPSNNQCAIVPTDTFTGTSNNWINVPGAFNVNIALTQGVPQYQIHLIGTGTADDTFGSTSNANSANYGASGAPDNVAYYRVTARSSNPALSGDRAIVVLQTTVRRPFP